MQFDIRILHLTYLNIRPGPRKKFPENSYLLLKPQPKQALRNSPAQTASSRPEQKKKTFSRSPLSPRYGCSTVT
uniref:Uncharacterized protein n=1 Tax=Octopus bimaculoides TaxID=37653 RepID=A0A0L8G086_OCTBM